MKKVLRLAITASMIYSAGSLGCSFHEPGASKIAKFPPISPALHPVMLKHFSPPEVAPINLSLMKVNDQQSDKETLTINYEVHPDYSDVKAEVVSSGDVQLSGRTSMYLTRLKGAQTIQFSAGNDARKIIRVRISAVRHDEPILVEKRIFI